MVKPITSVHTPPMSRAAVMLTAPDGVEAISVDTEAENFAGELLGGPVTFVASVEFPTSSVVVLGNRAEQEAREGAPLDASILPPPDRREAQIYGSALAVRVGNSTEPLDLHVAEYFFEVAGGAT